VEAGVVEPADVLDDGELELRTSPLLRHLGLVVGRRDGRQVIYDLHDEHVGELLEQAIGHVEHLRRGLSHAPSTAELAEA
jgi:DNA-binding transcriptional ArsR family regulator